MAVLASGMRHILSKPAIVRCVWQYASLRVGEGGGTSADDWSQTDRSWTFDRRGVVRSDRCCHVLNTLLGIPGMEVE